MHDYSYMYVHVNNQPHSIVVSLSHTLEREVRGSGVKPIRSLFLRNVAVFQNCVKLCNTHVHDKGERPRVCLRKSNLIRLQNLCNKYKLQIGLTPDPHASRLWVWLSKTNSIAQECLVPQTIISTSNVYTAEAQYVCTCLSVAKYIALYNPINIIC